MHSGYQHQVVIALIAKHTRPLDVEDATILVQVVKALDAGLAPNHEKNQAIQLEEEKETV